MQSSAAVCVYRLPAHEGRGAFVPRSHGGDATASHPLPCLATPGAMPIILWPLAPKYHAVALFASLVRGLSWAPDHLPGQ